MKSNRALPVIQFFTLFLVFIINTNLKAQNLEEWAVEMAINYDILPNITYSTAENIDLKLDLYLPKNIEQPVPVLLLFHGGGWVAGQKERNTFWFLPYLTMGWAVANVEYRMARSSLAPAAAIDCRCALRWISANARRFKLDPDKIVLTGTSAGGHLALLTGMLADGNILDRSCPAPDSLKWNSGKTLQVKVAAIINWFGIPDVADLLEGANAKGYAIEWLGSQTNRMEIAKLVSPINYVRKDVPPILTLHGDRDDISPYANAAKLHAELDRAGAPNRLFTVIGAGHSGFNRKQMMECWSEIKNFLRKYELIK